MKGQQKAVNLKIVSKWLMFFERAYNIRTRTGDDYMLDVNMIIAKNIQAELKKETKIKC